MNLREPEEHLRGCRFNSPCHHDCQFLKRSLFILSHETSRTLHANANTTKGARVIHAGREHILCTTYGKGIVCMLRFLIWQMMNNWRWIIYFPSNLCMLSLNLRYSITRLYQELQEAHSYMQSVWHNSFNIRVMTNLTEVSNFHAVSSRKELYHSG